MRESSLCNILLDLGADVSIQTKLGHNALMLAFMPGIHYTSDLNDLTPRCSGSQLASKQLLDRAVIQKMVTLGATTLRSVDNKFRSVLHHLALSNNEYGAQLVLKHATQEMINQQDEDGNTPLHLVCDIALLK